MPVVMEVRARAWDARRATRARRARAIEPRTDGFGRAMDVIRRPRR